jgi:hypothetical protein
MRAELQSKIIPLGRGGAGFPKRTFFYRPGDLNPCFVFNRSSLGAAWQGHDKQFQSMEKLKEWVERQEFMRKFAKAQGHEA